jgi:hypothetical protein
LDDLSDDLSSIPSYDRREESKHATLNDELNEDQNEESTMTIDSDMIVALQN